MTRHDDFDRTLSRWFEDDALSPAPVDGLDRVLDATRRRGPRPAWLAGPGSHWVGSGPSADLGVGGRRLPGLEIRWSTVVVMFLLGLAIAAGAILVAGQHLPLPGPADPGNRLTYVRDEVLYVADWDGRNPVRVSRTGVPDGCSGAHMESGIWSPDGRYLAYRSGLGPDCLPTVQIGDAQGNAIAGFSAGDGWDAAWAPDSKRVVAWGITEDGAIEIRGVDGVLQAQLTLPDGYCLCGDRDPEWTHDGTAILIKMGQGGVMPTQYWRLPISGGSPSRLIEGGFLPPTCCLVYSPDGTKAAWWSDGQLLVARTEDMSVPLTAVKAEEMSRPIWSPADDLIAVTMTRDQVLDSDGYVASATQDLVVLDLASGVLTTLATEHAQAGTAHPQGAIHPLAFSPDGKRILLWRADAAGTASLWTMNTDGSGARELVHGADSGDWQPRPAGS